jgi:methionyl-tRNA formyltransferase
MVDAGSLRVVFFGTPRFALTTLDRLLASSHHVAAVVTQPDRPRGRGWKAADAPVKARAVEAGLPVLQPAALKDSDFQSQLRDFHPDVGVVAAYGRILPETMLRIPRLGMINVHASLLPRYRGAAPVHRAVIAGESQTGVTIMRVVRELDAGPMLATATRQIGPDETSDVVERGLAALGADLLVATLNRMASGAVAETPQDERLATYALRLTKEDGIVNWAQPASTIHNLIRGLYPWPHAFSFLGGRRLILLKSLAIDTTVHADAGTIVAARGGELRVAAGEGLLQIIELQAEGGRPMSAREFIIGRMVAAGERFSAMP